MFSADTNVLARYLVGDDATQAKLAEAAIESGIYVPLTVLMETSWLLGSLYKFDKKTIMRLFEVLRATDSVRIAEDDQLDWLLARYSAGADFADLIHLLASRGQSGFATFDKNLRKQAGEDAPVSIKLLT